MAKPVFQTEVSRIHRAVRTSPVFLARPKKHSVAGPKCTIGSKDQNKTHERSRKRRVGKDLNDPKHPVGRIYHILVCYFKGKKIGNAKNERPVQESRYLKASTSYTRTY